MISSFLLQVHKLVLLAISPTLLSSSEVRNNCFLRVNFPANISENAMRAFAEYMYNGVLDLDPLTLTQLQQISYQLGIVELRMLCETHLCSQTQVSSSINNVICPGTSLSHLATQSESSSLQMSLQRKHSSAPEVQKRTLSTNSWLQSSGSQEFVSLSPVAVKTEPQNSVQDYYSANPTVQTSHPVRSTPAAWPVSEATYCQRSSSSSMTKASKTIKTFQEHDPTIESKFVSHIKLEPIDNLEYGQPHPTLSSNASTLNLLAHKN